MSAQAAVTVLKVTPAEGQYVPDFGPNVFVVDQSMNITDIQTVCDNIYSKQQANIPSGSPGSSEFTTNRYALLFKPGTYTDPNDINVGFYTQDAGLGTNPDDVTINGGVARNADWMGQNATDNFWSSVINMAINPTVDGGKMYWAVSQATPLRRVHVKGDLWLFKWGNSSGGFLGDSKIDGTVESGSQQQWMSRNDTWNAWSDGVWNMMFVGDANTTPPAAGSTLSGTWPVTTATQVAKTPVEREEPFLTYNNTSGNYNIFVPSLEKGTTGVDWPNTVGTSVPVDGTHVYIAYPDTDTAETINAQLNDGKDLILTPGIYHIDEAIDVKNANTVVLGLGFATLIPTAGNAAITVADVDGVSVSGLIIDAGTVDSPVLLQVGPTTSTTDHSADPTLISDVYFRVGGATAGTADSCFVVNSNNVIGDNLWVWRADHGAGATPIWTGNPSANGLIVNGNNVTMYGLAVEHFQQYQTIWNGDGGQVYFYQSELPYDVPSQSAWSHDGVNGYASFKVDDSVTSFKGWGFGIYSYFDQGLPIIEDSAIEAPINSNVIFDDAATVFLSGSGEVTHVINGTGIAANSSYADKTAEIYNSTPPVITLNGVSTVYVTRGSTYTDLGATASDATDGDITSNIFAYVTNSNNDFIGFSSDYLWTYTVHYTVTNSAGFPAAEVDRTVIVTNPTSTGGSSTPVPTKITGTTGTDGSTSAQITPTQTNSSTVSNVTVALGSVTVTAPSSVFNSALGSSGTSTLSLAQTSTSTATQTAVNAAEASSGITPISTLDIDLTNVSSSGALVPVHQLSGNITVTIALTDAQIAKIIDVSRARLFYFDPDTNTLTDMNATFDLTAKTVSFTTNHFSTYVIANTTSTSTATTPANNIGVTYNAQVQHIGWQSFVSDGAQAGTTGKALRLEGAKINLTGNVPQGAKITYQAQVQKLGWMSAVSNGLLAGTVGKALRLEALKITLSGMSGYEVEYRAQVQGTGWQKWQVSKHGTSISSAAIAGITGKGLRLEAIEIKIVKIS